MMLSRRVFFVVAWRCNPLHAPALHCVHLYLPSALRENHDECAARRDWSAGTAKFFYFGVFARCALLVNLRPMNKHTFFLALTTAAAICIGCDNSTDTTTTTTTTQPAVTTGDKI